MKKRVRRVAEIARRIGSHGDTGRDLVQEFRQRFAEMPSEQRLQLFAWLAGELEVGKKQIERPAGVLMTSSETDRALWNDRIRELRRALASPRQRLLEALINTGGGMQFVLELRAQVLDAQRQGAAGLEALEEDIAHLLNRWCQHGLLYLEEINLHSSYRTVRFLKQRELVHPMVSLDEMGRRLGDDRMCFALYHAVMPEEPVIFIEVALSHGLLRSIDEVIGERDGPPEKSPDTAIFYSINNTQNGLSGLGLGQVLIVRVTESLRRRHPSLETFATLSPIPGFWGRYLQPILEGRGDGFALDRNGVEERFTTKARNTLLAHHRAGGGDGEDLATALAEILSRPDWIDDPVLRRLLRKPLIDIASTYLSEETDARGRPLNPVAGFHLGNGASVSRANVNFAANTSRRGLEESCGLMVNYVYAEGALAPLGRAFRSLLPWGRSHRS